MSRKRPRDEGWWQQAVDWVQSHPGGKVHPGVKVSDQRELSVEQAQEEGTELLRIPFSCLVSNATIKSTTFGQQIVDTIQNLEPRDLYSPVQDLAVALYLAKYSARESSAAAEDTKFRPYLDTLPERSSYDGLPRLWPEDDLKYLRGSPLLKRVQDQKKGIQKDYDIIHQAWKDNGQGEDSFPAFEDFSYRLAAVTSRAFAGFGSLIDAEAKQPDNDNNDDMNIAMVPLLDLCNHCRGKTETKNLSYKRGPAGEIIVTASQQIQAGENLRITYGARSNAQLLLNYGFCIPDNIEPDGSSNDFLEFSVQENKTVELRAGPKAHSFHGFVNALDSFAAPPSKGKPKKDDEEDEGDDFDANEKEFDQWDMDMMGDMGGEEEEEEEEDDEGDDDEAMKQEKEQLVARYLAALTLLETRLKEVWGAYYWKGKELQDALASSTANQRSAALLIQSEHRTMFFVLCVIRRLQQQLSLLGKADQKESSTKDDADDDEAMIVLTKADKKLLLEQANEVASAFLAIRLPG